MPSPDSLFAGPTAGPLHASTQLCCNKAFDFGKTCVTVNGRDMNAAVYAAQAAIAVAGMRLNPNSAL